MRIIALVGVALLFVVSTLEARGGEYKRGIRGVVYPLKVVNRQQVPTYTSVPSPQKKYIAKKSHVAKKPKKSYTPALPKDIGSVKVNIDVSSQRMKVYHRGKRIRTMKVSTGVKKHETPRGHFKPLWTTKMHYSKKYHNTPMPYSIFFRKNGYAIHGTKAVWKLGKKASHGCVRLSSANAKWLYKLVNYNGTKNTKIKIIN